MRSSGSQASRRTRLSFADDRLKNFRDVGGVDSARNKVRGGAKHKILNQQQIDLVPIGGKLVWLGEITLEKKAKAVLTRHGGGSEEMPEIDGLHFVVQLIQPMKIALASLFVRP